MSSNKENNTTKLPFILGAVGVAVGLIMGKLFNKGHPEPPQCHRLKSSENDKQLPDDRHTQCSRPEIILKYNGKDDDNNSVYDTLSTSGASEFVQKDKFCQAIKDNAVDEDLLKSMDIDKTNTTKIENWIDNIKNDEEIEVTQNAQDRDKNTPQSSKECGAFAVD